MISFLENQSELAEECQAYAVTKEDLAELKAQLREKTKAIEDFESRVEEKDQYIRSLEEKCQHARKSLEYYRQSVKEQRDQDLRLHEQKVQQLLAEIRQQAQSLVVKQNNLFAFKLGHTSI